MICRRSLFLCCVLMQFLLNASRDSQTTKTSIKSSFLNQYDNVRHIYFYWICNETVFTRARCFNERFMKWADLHAVLITMKCVSFVCKCVNVSVSFLKIFLCTSPLHLKKNAVLKKKLINKVKGHYLMSENDPFVLIPRKCSVVTVKWGPCNRQIT